MLHSQIMSAALQNKSRKNFRFKQLRDLEKEINWDDLLEAILPYYAAANICRLLVTAESMIRIYFLQHRYGISSSGVEEALFQIDVFREFSLIDLDSDVIPNASCIEDFNSLLVEKNLTSKIQIEFNIQPIMTVGSAEV